MMGLSRLMGMAAAVVLVALSPAAAGFEPVERPFIWMNQQEIEGARQRLENEPWAERALADSLWYHRGREVPHYRSFFNILVHDDDEAAEAEKRRLMAFTNVDVTQTPPRENRVLDVIRYDILYDRLTEDERERVENAFRRWIHYHLHEYWRGRDSIVIDGEERSTHYTRTNWLPNMHHPRGLGIFLMAVALQDEELIRECFATPVAGFKWWMDHYVADGRFYMEEFGKMPPTVGELLLWCRGVERLGLGELGFGYIGEGDGPGHSPGGSMKRYVKSWLDQGLPAEPAPEGAMPTYPGVHMGDASRPPMIRGYAPDADTPHPRWGSARMLGPAPRMLMPLWFEIAHVQWPDAGFDWVLAQKRMPDQDRYYPSLFFNLDPIDPEQVEPFPVASYVASERGFGMLRMQECGDYWTSPRPAVALQFGMYYVHYVHDCFTLMHYIANRRPVYGRRAFGPHGGYAGGHPWIDSVRGHNGIVVDNKQIKPVDDGRHGAEHTGIRHHFADEVKFLAIDAIPRELRDEESGEARTVGELYPGVAVERALALTDHYMLDVFHLQSDRERTYHWNHHPAGAPRESEAEADTWQPSDDLDGGRLFENMDSIQRRHGERLAGGEFDLPDVHKREFGRRPWQLCMARGEGEDELGVKIRMLDGPPTTVYRDVGQGVTTVIAERRAPSTTFIALHEPTVGSSRLAAFERIEQADEGLAVRVRGLEGEGVDDRILIAHAGHAEADLTLGDDRESFTFRGFAHVRLAGDKVVIHGDLRSLRVPVADGVETVILNGERSVATVRDGVLRVE